MKAGEAMAPAQALTIRDAQTRQPWTVPYAKGVNAAATSKMVAHILGSHCALHAAKSVGKLATVFEAMDHRDDEKPLPAELAVIRSMAADLLTAALRFANLYGFDLENELRARVLEKNGVEL